MYVTNITQNSEGKTEIEINKEFRMEYDNLPQRFINDFKIAKSKAEQRGNKDYESIALGSLALVGSIGTVAWMVSYFPPPPQTLTNVLLVLAGTGTAALLGSYGLTEILSGNSKDGDPLCFPEDKHEREKRAYINELTNVNRLIKNI
jgi:hypothetical protein